MQSSGWQDPPPTGGGGGPTTGMQLAMPSLTPTVKALILINVVVFALTYLATFRSPAAWFWIGDHVGIGPDVWKAWFPFPPVWQLVTYGFLHDVNSLTHILFNLLFLYFLGTMLEGIVGSRRMAVHFVGAVALAGLAQLMFGLVLGESGFIVGASGGVLFVVVATATFRPKTRVIFILFPITLKTLALIYVGLDVFGVLQNVKGMGDGVARAAHLTGAAFGFLAVRRGWIWKDPIASLEARREVRAVEQAAEDEHKLDALLEKIHREGIHSLSAREKAFLKRSSKKP